VFVEDLVRNVALRLNAHPLVTWYKVEAENCESIHNHNAYACIERRPEIRLRMAGLPRGAA
jgi:GTP cyclohydrolase I